MNGPISIKKSTPEERQSAAYIGATLATFLIAGLIAFSWTSAIDNWFKVHYPDGKDSVVPRFVSAVIITIVAIIVLRMILRIKKL